MAFDQANANQMIDLGMIILALWTLLLLIWTVRLASLTNYVNELELENKKLKWWIRHYEKEDHRSERF
jgi:hypothetical protein